MVRLRFLLLAVVASVTLLGSRPASSAEWKPFDAAAFAEAQKDGKPMLVATNLDKRIETILVNASPAWLTELTTRL